MLITNFLRVNYLIVGRVFIGYANILNYRTFIYFFLEILISPIIIYKQVKVLKKENPNIIHLNSSILFLTAISAKILKIPIVWHVREVLIGGRYNLKKKFVGYLIRKLANQVICISEIEASSLGNNSFNNVNVVYNFIDFSKFTSIKKDINKVKEKYNLGNKKNL